MEQLSQKLATKGADMLMDCLTNRLYLYGSLLPIPEKNTGSPAVSIAGNARHAPKITTADRFVDWRKSASEDILRRHRIIGPLWSSIKSDEHSQRERRVIWSSGFEPTLDPPKTNLPIGQPMVTGSHSPSRAVYVRTCDDQVLKINHIKIDGGEENEPHKAAVRARIHDPTTTDADGPLFRAQLSPVLPKS